MQRFAFVLAMTGTLAACATARNPLLENYAGPRAILRDSVTNYNGTKADYFFLYEYNGTRTRQTYDLSMDNSRGTGFMLLPPEVVQRYVPAEPGTYYLIGRTGYAAPIQDLIHGVRMVKGEVGFTPRAGAVYVIRRCLSAAVAEVWIEDAATGKVVSEKLSTATPRAITSAHPIDVVPNGKLGRDLPLSSRQTSCHVLGAPTRRYSGSPP